ncbi:hypothetical protein ACVGVM_24370 [Pseudonocardia bannensis]|uniref:Small secreted hydrophilic protein n=1 Tax=Pseudonocardia bannensis TaxID=630973 RepID=A0A848DFW8_9PSEU|nr:hypothetical protein [Pseudonocardia bannensis]NMH91548.1 hypothetical protein [Pseudonocardia bannensis]
MTGTLGRVRLPLLVATAVLLVTGVVLGVVALRSAPAESGPALTPITVRTPGSAPPGPVPAPDPPAAGFVPPPPLGDGPDDDDADDDADDPDDDDDDDG